MIVPVYYPENPPHNDPVVRKIEAQLLTVSDALRGKTSFHGEEGTLGNLEAAVLDLYFPGTTPILLPNPLEREPRGFSMLRLITDTVPATVAPATTDFTTGTVTCTAGSTIVTDTTGWFISAHNHGYLYPYGAAGYAGEGYKIAQYNSANQVTLQDPITVASGTYNVMVMWQWHADGFYLRASEQAWARIALW